MWVSTEFLSKKYHFAYVLILNESDETKKYIKQNAKKALNICSCLVDKPQK